MAVENPVDFQELPWWEEAGRAELRSTTNINDLRLVCTYVPFRESNTAQTILGGRDKSTLRGFLETLRKSSSINIDHGGRQGFRTIDDQFASELADETVTLLTGGHSAKPVDKDVKWDWIPPNTSTIAEVINFNVSSAFCAVTFPDWVSVALGNNPASFTNFVAWMNEVRGMHHRCLLENPHMKRSYEDVEKQSCSPHPCALWLVSSSLCLDPHVDSLDVSGQLCDALNSILRPIRDLFANEDRDLLKVLEKLSVFSVTFQYDMVRDGKWNKPFSPDISFLRNVRLIDPKNLAMSITEHDYDLFSKLSTSDILNYPDSTGIGLMEYQLSQLCDGVRACVTVDRDLVKPISVLVTHLVSARNFTSATAILSGLQRGNVRPRRLSGFWKLIDPSDNYSSYRKEWMKSPGLPFLTPHMRELKRTEDRARPMTEIFNFLPYIISKLPLSKNAESLDPRALISTCMKCGKRAAECGGLLLTCTSCHAHGTIAANIPGSEDTKCSVSNSALFSLKKRDLICEEVEVKSPIPEANHIKKGNPSTEESNKSRVREEHPTKRMKYSSQGDDQSVSRISSKKEQATPEGHVSILAEAGETPKHHENDMAKDLWTILPPPKKSLSTRRASHMMLVTHFMPPARNVTLPHLNEFMNNLIHVGTTPPPRFQDQENQLTSPHTSTTSLPMLDGDGSCRSARTERRKPPMSLHTTIENAARAMKIGKSTATTAQRAWNTVNIPNQFRSSGQHRSEADPAQVANYDASGKPNAYTWWQVSPPRAMKMVDGSPNMGVMSTAVPRFIATSQTSRIGEPFAYNDVGRVMGEEAGSPETGTWSGPSSKFINSHPQ